MASRFWVGGTGTWDASDTTHWAATSGTAGGQTVPGSGDTVTFDGSSGGGTVTVNHASLSVTSITAGAFTGTLDFNTNNNNVTAQTVDFGGSGTRTINMGSGTWTLTGTGGNVWSCNTTTGLTPTFQNAAIVFSGNSTSRNFLAGGPTNGYGSLTINNNSSKGYVNFTGTTTFASMTVGSGNTIALPQATTTITGALTITGTSTAPGGLVSNGVSAGVATISVGSASTIDWGGILAVTRSGAGTLTATNSLDMGRNSSFTSITPPSGGAVVGVIGG